MIYNGFSFLLFRYFYPLDIIWTLFLKKQAFSPCFKLFCEQKQDITQSSFYCPAMSLIILTVVFDKLEFVIKIALTSINNIYRCIADSQLPADLYFIAVHIISGVITFGCSDFSFITKAVIYFNFIFVCQIFVNHKILFA